VTTLGGLVSATLLTLLVLPALYLRLAPADPAPPPHLPAPQVPHSPPVLVGPAPADGEAGRR
jgi:hypothetical protein